MVKDVNGIQLKNKDVVSFIHTNFTGSVLHTEVKEGIVVGFDGKYGRLKVKIPNEIRFVVSNPNTSVTLLERRKREVLFEKYKAL